MIYLRRIVLGHIACYVYGNIPFYARGCILVAKEVAKRLIEMPFLYKGSLVIKYSCLWQILCKAMLIFTSMSVQIVDAKADSNDCWPGQLSGFFLTENSKALRYARPKTLSITCVSLT